MVLQRRPGKHDAEIGLHFGRRLKGFRFFVLNVVRFVKNRGRPRLFGQRLHFTREKPVSRNDYRSRLRFF